jgi:hypothetical protein
MQCKKKRKKKGKKKEKNPKSLLPDSEKRSRTRDDISTSQQHSRHDSNSGHTQHSITHTKKREKEKRKKKTTTTNRAPKATVSPVTYPNEQYSSP